MGHEKSKLTEYELEIEKSYNDGLEKCGCDNTTGFRDKCFIHSEGLSRTIKKRNELEKILKNIAIEKANSGSSKIKLIDKYKKEIFEALKETNYLGEKINDYSKENLSSDELAAKVMSKINELNTIIKNHIE